MIRVFEDLKVPILGFLMNSILSLLQNSFLVFSSFLFFFFFFCNIESPVFSTTLLIFRKILFLQLESL